MNKLTTLRELLNLNLHDFEEDVRHTVDRAVNEMAMTKTLADIESTWQSLHFEFDVHAKSSVKLLRISEELIETLEEHQVQVHNMSTSKYISYFEREFSEWARSLAQAEHVIRTWTEVQRKWIYLESIFVRSEDLRRQLPNDSLLFDVINAEFNKILTDEISCSRTSVIEITNKTGLCQRIELLLEGLTRCEKALNEYLETKRLAYPRFYFISATDLLDILSNGTDPMAIGRHLTKLYDSIMQLKYRAGTKMAEGMYAKENEEYVQFERPCDCSGKVECWLNDVTQAMRHTLRVLFGRAVVEYEAKVREIWVHDWPAQVALCITQIWWSEDVNEAFRRQAEGYEHALKDLQRKQVQQLNALIVLLLGELSVGDRQKIMTICTIDVHSRDIVARIIQQRIDSASAFQWQSQLRHRWDAVREHDCFVNICDAEFRYDYEYLGNTPRLVITPLTDRCYITLTQVCRFIIMHFKLLSDRCRYVVPSSDNGWSASWTGWNW